MTKRLLGLVVVATLAVPAPAQDDAKKIIDKAIAAHGGMDTLKKYKAAKSTIAGEMTVGGMDMTYTGSTASEFPGKWKLTVETSVMGQKIDVLHVVNGDKVKQKVTFGGMDVSPPGDEAKDEARETAMMHGIELIYPLLDEKKFSLKAEADGEVNGKKAAVIKATILDNSKTVTLSFDKESGLLVKTQRKGKSGDGMNKEVDEESFLSDYKKVNGVMSAHKLVVHHDGTKFMTCTMSDVEVLESLPAKTFATDD
jgi:hypothetical protein